MKYIAVVAVIELQVSSYMSVNYMDMLMHAHIIRGTLYDTN